MADEAANLIGEFDEGFSNRQTWNNAALAAIAVWFEDEELAGRARGGTHRNRRAPRAGLRGRRHVVRGRELPSLRPARTAASRWDGPAPAGVDVLADPRLAGRLASALRAPAVTALPDYTFPARKDSRFGVSLAQPMYLELWEVGLARLGDETPTCGAGWPALRAPAAGRATLRLVSPRGGAPGTGRPAARSDLSWWSLLEMAPSLPPAPAVAARAALLDSQGLAILRVGRALCEPRVRPHGGGHGSNT